MLDGLWADLQEYLQAELEIGEPEVMPAEGRNPEHETISARITATNTAPESDNWPKVVFVGVGVSITSFYGPSVRHPVITTDRSGLQTSQDPRDGQRIYARTSGETFPEITSDETRFGDVLFPGQSITYEVKIPTQDMPYTEFHVEGTVSRRHLLHYEHTLTPPDSYNRSLLVSALMAFNAIELHHVLDATLELLPNLGPDTRLAELQAFTTILSSGISEIEAIQAALNSVYRETPHHRIQTHIKAAYQYLSQVTAALAHMKDATSSTNAEKMSEASEAFRGLQSEATLINRATEELMLRYRVSDEEVSYRYRNR
jgi:hypothetical protein